MQRQLRLGPLLALLTAASLPSLGCQGGASHYPTRDAAVELPVETGAVAVNGGFTVCPTVVTQASPTMARVGQMVSVSGQAWSADGGALTLDWTAPSGTFADPSAAETSFTCGQAGPVVLTLTASDGACATTQLASIFCDAIPDGGVSGGGGMSGGTGTGGGAGGGGGATPNSCPAAEPNISGADCESCTKANCALAAGGDSGCCAITSATDQVLCEAVDLCLARNAGTCASDQMHVPCFCGTSGADCFMKAGAANGPCAGPVIAAAKTSSPPTIQLLFNNTDSPLGRATNLEDCRLAFCADECAGP